MSPDSLSIEDKVQKRLRSFRLNHTFRIGNCQFIIKHEKQRGYFRVKIEVRRVIILSDQYHLSFTLAIPICVWVCHSLTAMYAISEPVGIGKRFWSDKITTL